MADLMNHPDVINVYTYDCRAYLIRKEVLEDQEKVARKTKPRTHVGYLISYGGSNIYRIWVPQNGEIIVIRDVEFQEDEMFVPKDEPIREYRLRVYRKDPDGVELLPDVHPPQDKDTDSEIGSIIVVGNGNGLRDNRINEIDSEDDLNYLNEPKDYPIPQSIAEQTNSEVSSESSPAAILLEPSIEPEPSSKPILLESSLSRAKTPSSSS